MSQNPTKGAKAEIWAKAFAQQYGVLDTTSFSLEKVVTLLENKLQYKLVLAKPYVRQEFALANEWIDSIVAGRKVSGNIEEKNKLASKLLDLCVATDVILRLKDNKGIEQLIAVDVASNPNSEQSKLDTIRSKRDPKDTPGFNRNQNLGQVRQALGITKHLILVINPDNPPARESLINAVYAFANQITKTGSLNFFQSLTQEAEVARLPSSKQSNEADSLSLEKSKILAAIEQLPERELINTVKRVQAFFVSKPPQPPTTAEQLIVQQDVNKLQLEIGSLLKQQESQVIRLESMQKNPLRNWNKQYNAALGELEETIAIVEKTIAQKDQKHYQLQVWAEQTETYQAWVSAPQTKQMYQVAEAIKHPLIQQKIERVQQNLAQKQAIAPQKQQNQRSDRGRGLGL